DGARAGGGGRGAEGTIGSAAEDAGQLVGAAVGGFQGESGGASGTEAATRPRWDQSATAAAGHHRSLPPNHLRRMWRAIAGQRTAARRTKPGGRAATDPAGGSRGVA